MVVHSIVSSRNSEWSWLCMFLCSAAGGSETTRQKWEGNNMMPRYDQWREWVCLWIVKNSNLRRAVKKLDRNTAIAHIGPRERDRNRIVFRCKVALSSPSTLFSTFDHLQSFLPCRLKLHNRSNCPTDTKSSFHSAPCSSHLDVFGEASHRRSN